MSKLRGLVPVLLATGFGVLNGYIIFKPAYEDLEAKKLQKLQESQSTELGPELKDVPITGANPPSIVPQSGNRNPDETPQTWTRQIWAWYTGTSPASATSPTPTTSSSINDEK